MHHVRNLRYTTLIKTSWSLLHSIAPLDPVPEKLLNVSPSPSSLTNLLSIAKGRKLIPKLIEFLPKPQMILLIASVFKSFASLIIVSGNSSNTSYQYQYKMNLL